MDERKSNDPVQQAVAIASKVNQPLSLISAKQWLEERARTRWEHRGSPPNDALSDWFAEERELETRAAHLQGENLSWIRSHEADILAEHPGYVGKNVAVCSQTDKKVLAIEDDRNDALLTALEHPDLLDLAVRVDLPAAVLPTIFVLGDP